MIGYLNGNKITFSSTSELFDFVYNYHPSVCINYGETYYVSSNYQFNTYAYSGFYLVIVTEDNTNPDFEVDG